VGRDGTYDLLTSIWRLSHPDSRSPDAEFSDSESDGSYSEGESVSGDDDNVSTQSNASVAGSDEERAAPKAADATSSSEKKGDEAEGTSAGDEGPESHEKTECDCGKDGHFEKVIFDDVIKAPLGKVWNRVYGDDKEFILSFLRDHQKLLGRAPQIAFLIAEISTGDWKAGDGVKRERQVSYIKPLNNSMGPKQTKCNITEQVQAQDFNSSCVALSTTTTPDVPSGSSFQILTKYCMMWAGGTSTRILITCSIEWSKSSWIKGAIEKGSNEGQMSYAKDLVAELRRKLERGTAGGKKKSGGKKRSAKEKKEETRDEERPAEEKAERSGVFSTLLQVGETVGDVLGPIVKPLFSSAGIISILLVMVFYALIRVERTMRTIGTVPTSRPASVPDPPFRSSEDSVWDWVDSRIGKVSQQERDGKVIWNTLVDEGLEQHGLESIEDVIRTTEGKLKALKGVVEKKRNNMA
jgi:hypothetical protein